MIDRAVGEAATHRQTAVPGPDDHRRRAYLGGPSLVTISGQMTSTLTSVGFVMMSYTADRFCDCATSALISSGVASASIL